MITGRRALARLRVNEPGEVVELDREHLLALVQTDAELSEILMRRSSCAASNSSRVGWATSCSLVRRIVPAA